MDGQLQMTEELIVVNNPGQISDGCHTFDELYEHRNLLFINLCLLWYSDHSDGTCWNNNGNYDGYFCLYFWGNGNKQISYHIPNKYLSLVDKPRIDGGLPCEAIDWDGHTSADVIERLIKRAQGDH